MNYTTCDVCQKQHSTEKSMYLIRDGFNRKIVCPDCIEKTLAKYSNYIITRGEHGDSSSIKYSNYIITRGEPGDSSSIIRLKLHNMVYLIHFTDIWIYHNMEQFKRLIAMYGNIRDIVFLTNTWKNNYIPPSSGDSVKNNLLRECNFGICRHPIKEKPNDFLTNYIPIASVHNTLPLSKDIPVNIQKANLSKYSMNNGGKIEQYMKEEGFDIINFFYTKMPLYCKYCDCFCETTDYCTSKLDNIDIDEYSISHRYYPVGERNAFFNALTVALNETRFNPVYNDNYFLRKVSMTRYEVKTDSSISYKPYITLYANKDTNVFESYEIDESAIHYSYTKDVIPVLEYFKSIGLKLLFPEGELYQKEGIYE